MKVRDKVQMREAPQAQGVIRRIAGHQVTVQWSAHTSTTVPRYMLKPYQPQIERDTP